MFKIFTTLLCLAVLLGCNAPKEKGQTPVATPTKKVIAYVYGNEYRLDTMELNYQGLTHLIYSFANIKDGKAFIPEPQDSINIGHLQSLKEKFPKIKVVLAIGGWTWSGNFSDAALSDSSRTIFVNSVKQLVQNHALDGIDIDWEYPNLPGFGNKHRVEDIQNFTFLMRDLREGLNTLSKQTSVSYELSVAVGAGKAFLENTEMEKVHPYVDHINVMTYDYYGSWDAHTGHNAPLYVSSFDQMKKASIHRSISNYLNKGIPSKKLILGLAFYGKSWKGVGQRNNGLFEPASGAYRKHKFWDIVNDPEKYGFTRKLDSAAMVPYLWNAADSAFISYDNEASYTSKLEYAKEKNLGGVMFWELKGDKKGEKVKLIQEVLQAP